MVRSRKEQWLRFAAIALGILVVLIGAADVAARLSRTAFGEDAAFVAFGPAAAAPVPLVQAEGTLIPARLAVPSLGIDAAVEHVGQKQDGSMGTPQDFDNVAWYALGSKPGAPGNAVFAGHVNNALTKPGVFEHLAAIEVGDYVTVSDETGVSKVYRVETIEQHPYSEAPAADIFATRGPSKLVLITCDGEWVASERTFEKRLIVTAALTN